MQILELPFNKLIALEFSPKADFLLMLKSDPKYLNHIQTIHASALFSLAEATSGHFLSVSFSQIPMALIPVVRNVTVKYKSAAKGCIFSRAMLQNSNIIELNNTLEVSKKAQLNVVVELFDEIDKLVFQGNFEWFIMVAEKITTN